TTYGLPFELGELRLGSDATETTARRARYAWLAEVRRRREARYVVTAHHRDDQVETILLRVLRGSGPAGLAGIAARARGGRVRPLAPAARARRLLTLAAGPSGRRQSLGGGWVAEAAFHRLRMTRGTAAALEQVVATADQGGAHFGTFQVAWRVEPAPARVERGGWSTWLP